jgi:hypothetical protein
MPRWLIILASAVALLLASAWVWSFVTKTGVLFSASDYMVSDLSDGGFDPTATDEPIGKLCAYVGSNGVHSLILLDRSQAGVVDHAGIAEDPDSDRLDPRLRGDVEMVDSWYDAKCPATRAAPR